LRIFAIFPRFSRSEIGWEKSPREINFWRYLWEAKTIRSRFFAKVLHRMVKAIQTLFENMKSSALLSHARILFAFLS